MSDSSIDATHSGRPLPANIQLLSTEELQDLACNHRGQLSQYLSQFQKDHIETIAADTRTDREQLESLRAQFESLEAQRQEVNGDIDKLKALTVQYRSRWQDLQTLYQQQYSETAFRNRLETRVRALEQECSTLQSQLYTLGVEDSDLLDNYLREFNNRRRQYHYYREQLATWNEQDSLRQ